jgi:hypothetical protein
LTHGAAPPMLVLNPMEEKKMLHRLGNLGSKEKIRGLLLREQNLFGMNESQG